MSGLRAALLLLIGGLLAAAEALVLVGGYDPAIRSFALADDGGLTPLATSPVGPNPSFLVVTPDARFAYAVSEVGSGRVVACTLDRASGALGALGTASSGGKGPAHLALHPSGRWLTVADYGDGAVAVLPIRPDGGIGEPVCTVAAGANAHMALPSPSGRRLYVPCKGADRLVTYRFDPDSGQLDRIAAAGTAVGAGPRHLALALDGTHGWLVDELSSAVQPVGAIDGDDPVLGQPVSTLPPGWTGRNTGGGILLAAGGRLLLASNRGHDSIAVFRLGADGTPTPAGHVGVGRTPRHLALSPDGRFVLVACQDAGRVEVLRVEGDRLVAVGGAAVPRPACVVAVERR